MALQFIGERFGYVVEFDELPQLPVTGLGYERPYAEALTDAIVTGVITEGGKYFISFACGLPNNFVRYEVARVDE